MKKCKRCGEEKPEEAFPVNYTRKDGTKGRLTYCQSCKNDQRKEWRNRFPLDRAAQDRERDASKAYQERQTQETLITATHYKVEWSAEDEQYLRDHWNDSLRELAYRLGRTYTAVARRKTILRQREVDTTVPSD